MSEIYNPNNTYNNNQNIGSIIIPEGIIHLPVDEFQNSSITSITLPNSLLSIGDRCFARCSSLTSIILPNNLISIGESCFADCSSLTSITLQNSITSIGNWCFNSCSSLTSITLPNLITSVGDGCFFECSSIISITLPNIISIGLWSFYGCSSLYSISLPNSLKSIDDWCFNNCVMLKYMTINTDNFEFIGSNIVAECVNLTFVDLPNINRNNPINQILLLQLQPIIVQNLQEYQELIDRTLSNLSIIEPEVDDENVLSIIYDYLQQ